MAGISLFGVFLFYFYIMENAARAELCWWGNPMIRFLLHNNASNVHFSLTTWTLYYFIVCMMSLDSLGSLDYSH